MEFVLSKGPAFATAVLLLSTGSAVAQKGVDQQTQTIRSEGNRVTSRTSDVGRTFDWGQGKTKTRALLSNPYRFSGRRDALISSVLEVLRERRIVVDEAASRVKEGFIVTQPYVFAKGSVTTVNELNRYGVLETADAAWLRGQYTLTIEVQPIDGVNNNVSVIAKVEGRAGTGLTTEWVTVRSSGVAEDEFLSKLVEVVTGTPPEGLPIDKP
jgi:hypothetical protein